MLDGAENKSSENVSIQSVFRTIATLYYFCCNMKLKKLLTLRDAEKN